MRGGQTRGEPTLPPPSVLESPQRVGFRHFQRNRLSLSFALLRSSSLSYRSPSLSLSTKSKEDGREKGTKSGGEGRAEGWGARRGELSETISNLFLLELKIVSRDWLLSSQKKLL